ncbi:MAG: tetratricopeptide repeat protein, partial [Bdellovibrionales bacterium]|nr:tetratricopeptide repeat protein [Bdellovibrionales bacterium]
QARSGFLKTSRDFLKMAPNSKRAGDIQYTIASIYYDQNDWEDAIKSFEFFIGRYPNHSKIAEAARLLLDSYNMKDDTGGMVAAGKRMLSSGRFRNPALLREVRDIISKAEFKNLEEALTEKGEISNVASGFFQLSRQYKGTEAGEKALYNAFVSARKANQPSQMIAAAEQLRKDYPRSKLLEELLPMVSQTMLEVGLFNDGASAAEKFNQSFPQSEVAGDLLVHAGKVRAALGQYRQASQDFETAAKRARGGKSASVLESYAMAMNQSEQWQGLERAAALWRNADSSNAQAYALMARAQFRQGKLAQAQRTAQAGKSKVNSLSGLERAEAAAELSYLEVAPAYQRYMSIQVPRGNARAEEQATAVKSKLLASLEKAYTQIAGMGSGPWAIAALSKVAHAYNDFAKFLSQTSMPAGLSGGQAAQYRQAIMSKVSEIQQNARNLYQTCQQRAHQLHLYTHEALECSYQKQIPYPGPQRGSGSAAASQSNFQSLVRTLVKNPKDISALNNMARIYLGAGRFSSAFLALSRAIEIDANNAEALNLMGVVLQKLNKDEDAYASYEKALRANGSLPQALANIANLCKKHRDQACYQQAASRVNQGQLNGVPPSDIYR